MIGCPCQASGFICVVSSAKEMPLPAQRQYVPSRPLLILLYEDALQSSMRTMVVLGLILKGMRIKGSSAED